MRSKTAMLLAVLIIFTLHQNAVGRGLSGGNANARLSQHHADEFFITVFNSSYQLPSCYYDHNQARYFSRDGINNLVYFPWNKGNSVDQFLAGAGELGMNGVIWFPGLWIRQGFNEAKYKQWVRRHWRSHRNIFAWYMPDELPSTLMKADKKRNIIYDPDIPGMHDPADRGKPWFLNLRNPDDENTVIGRTRWYARIIRDGDPEAHIMLSPSTGGPMKDLDKWTAVLEHLSEYCDVWIRGAYPNWIVRPRSTLLDEYEKWLTCRERARQRGTDVDKLYFILLLESFKGPYSNPVNYISPEIIRFDAYASLTLGSQGLMWWEGKSWEDRAPGAQAMYEGIFSVAREINIPQGPHLARCLLADEPAQRIRATIVSGQRYAPPYYGNNYGSIHVRLKQEGRGGRLYLFVANFSEKWEGKSFKSSGGSVKARFDGFESGDTRVRVVVDSRSSNQVGREIAIKDGAFVDDFPELTARVYRVLK